METMHLPVQTTNGFGDLHGELDDARARGRLRSRNVVVRTAPGRLAVDGREYVDFSSNDYLGLAADDRVRAAARRAIDDFGWGAAASPLLGGFHKTLFELENALADFEQTESAIVFQTGFAANLGLISALAGHADAIFSDQRNHASLIDGCRLSKATVELFQSDALEGLESLLKKAAGFRRRLIVSDSVFSMDGDIAPLPDLVELADRFDALLYIDEAHATGVLGQNGRGAAELFSVDGRIDFRMGTLSKALGSLGGFLAATETTVQWVVNNVRPYIYSTALPPAAAAAAVQALHIVQSEPERRVRALTLAQDLRLGLEERGFNVGRSRGTTIVPIIAGTAERALALSEHLRNAGFWAPAIRPPTVPTGASRVRLNVSAAHNSLQIENLLHAASVWRNQATP